MRMHTLASLVVAILTGSSVFGQSPRAVSADPPRDAAHPAFVLFHGIPGNEKDLDLDQAVRRAGWNAITPTRPHCLRNLISSAIRQSHVA